VKAAAIPPKIYMRVGPSLSAYILCLGGLHLIRSKTVGEQLMNPHWAWLNFFICYDVPGSHANHGPQIHTCSCRTRERNLPGRRDAVVTTLLILRYKPFPHDYTDLRRDRPRREAVFLKKATSTHRACHLREDFVRKRNTPHLVGH